MKIFSKNSRCSITKVRCKQKFQIVFYGELNFMWSFRVGLISFNIQSPFISLRTGRKSTIITTNLGFDRREEVFGDTPKTIKRTWKLF